MDSQIRIKDNTMNRIEKITGKKFIRGGDKLVNQALDKLEQTNSTEIQN